MRTIDQISRVLFERRFDLSPAELRALLDELITPARSPEELDDPLLWETAESCVEALFDLFALETIGGAQVTRLRALIRASGPLNGSAAAAQGALRGYCDAWDRAQRRPQDK